MYCIYYIYNSLLFIYIHYKHTYTYLIISICLCLNTYMGVYAHI